MPVRTLSWLWASCLAALLLLPAPGAGFIRVFNQTFADEACHEFAFVGANTWRMLEAQANLTGVTVNGQNPVENLLDTAASLNISVIRMFAAGTTPELPLLIKPGTYNQVALTALDQVLDAAARRGLRITLILARNWGPPDSKAIFASWSGLPSPDDFFISPSARQDFKDHIDFMLNRTNTVNGRRYRVDPTIFSWNLMNEPRYFDNNTFCDTSTPKCVENLQSWIEEMTAHLRSAAPNQLITVGSEGFFGKEDPLSRFNPAPDQGWVYQTGQDFARNFAKGLDYAELHAWPDNWNVSDPNFFKSYIQAHEQSAQALGLPLVIEEFGKNVTNHDPATIARVRNPIFGAILGELNVSLASNGPLKGAAYWMWDPSLTGPQSSGWGNYSQDQVMPSESTMKDIIAPTAKAAAAHAGIVPGCKPQLPPAPEAPVAAGQGSAPASAGRKLKRWADDD